jgi:hypothetical protein
MKKRKKEIEWVVAGGKVGELAHCTRCGQGLAINLPQLMTVMVAAMRAFAEAHSNCEPTWTEPEPKTWREWAEGRDTGVSSFTIWAVMTGLPSPMKSLDVPYDPADFGRCYRLLKLMPEWRPRLGRVTKHCARWRPFVDAWDELTALYEEELPTGTCPRLYARMKELEKAGESCR